MTEDPLVESHAVEALNAELIAQQARDKAQHVQMKQAFTEAVTEMLSENPTRYIDVSRVPLICQALIGLNDKMDKMVTQDQFWPVKTIVYGAVGLILTAVILALAYLVIHTQVPVSLM